MSRLDPASLTHPQKTLVGLGLPLLPAALGLTIPGGVVSDTVDLDFVSIFLATMPWTISIALMVWLLEVTEGHWTGFAQLGAVVGILFVGAWLGVELVPEQAVVTAEQADTVEYFLIAEQQGSVSEGGVAVAHNPKVGAAIVIFGIAAFLIGVYASLYGFALWVAGLACGLYLGWLLYRSFSEPEAAETG